MNETETKTVLEPKELRVIEADRQIRIARFSPCGRYLFAGCYDAAIRRWDFSGDEPQELEPLEGHRGWLESLAFSGDLLYSTDSWGQLCAWSWNREKPAPKWRNENAHDGWIRSMAVCANGKTIATAGNDRIVRIWSASDGRLLHELAGHEYEIYSVALHPDGKHAASGDLMGTLKCWDISTEKCSKEILLESMHFYDRIQDVAGLRILQFHNNGETLICAGSDPTKAGRAYGIPTIRMLDWPSLKVTKTHQFGPDKNGYVFDLHWHPDGFFMFVNCGPPGAGQFMFMRPDEEKPFYENTKMYNTHSLAVHLPTKRLAVAATNRSSQGNGAVVDKEGKYLGNSSPLHLFQYPPDPEPVEKTG